MLLRPTARVEARPRSWWCTTGRTELRSVSSGRDLNTPTSRRARRALLPVTVDAPARGLAIRRPASRSWGAVGCAESNRTAEAVLPIDNRAAPARDGPNAEQASQDSHPDQRGWSSRCCCYTTGLLRSEARQDSHPDRRGQGSPCSLCYTTGLQRADDPDRTGVRGKWGGRPDSNRRRGDHDPECLPLHHGHSGDGRARTGGLSPDKRALWPTELRPHLESRGWDSNPRSRAHEAREDNRSSTALLDLAGRTRTCERKAGSRTHVSRHHCEASGRGDVTGRGRTCDAPRFKRALYRLSYGHVNGRSADAQRACLSSLGSEARRTCGRSESLRSRREIVGCVANDVVHATRLPFDPGSPARRAASYVEGCWSPMLRRCHCINVHAKVTRTYTRASSEHRGGPFSLRRGLESGWNFSS